MRPNVIGVTRHKTSVLVLVVCVAVLMLTVGIPASASAHAMGTPAGANWGSHTIVVKPNGSNDTADLQNAFNVCTSNNWACTIQLVKGTYYTVQVAATGFRGSLVGAGEGLTVIQALPNLPSPAPAYNTPTLSFWVAPPSASNPWPVLFTFIGGSFQVSRLTISDSYYAPDQGYYWDGVWYTALFSTVLVTGTEANAQFDHVAVLGGTGDFGVFNTANAIWFAGLILQPGWTTDNELLPLSGDFAVTNSYFYSDDSGPWFWNLVNSDITVCYNTALIAGGAYGFFDTYGSVATFCGNRASDVEYGVGVLVWQGEEVFSNVPTSVSIYGNVLQVGNESNGVLLMDVTNSLSAVVSGNVIQTDTSCGCYLSDEPDAWTDSAITSAGLASVVVSGNTILGGGAAGVYISGSIVFGGDTYGGPATVSGNTILSNVVGVWVDYANYTHVSGNLIWNSAEWGIAVTDGSSNNLIAYNVVKNSGLYDLYWDGTGVGNTWAHNIYKTSNF